MPKKTSKLTTSQSTSAGIGFRSPIQLRSRGPPLPLAPNRFLQVQEFVIAPEIETLHTTEMEEQQQKLEKDIKDLKSKLSTLEEGDQKKNTQKDLTSKEQELEALKPPAAKPPTEQPALITESGLNQVIQNITQDQYLSEGSFADAELIKRYIRRVGPCDGTKPKQTLTWLRSLDLVPPHVRHQVAQETAEGALHESISSISSPPWKNHEAWLCVRQQIAEMYISANFAGEQKRTLRSAKQRDDETLASYNHYFGILMQEAYPGELPDQIELITDYLSGLDDQSMAKAVWGKKPKTVSEAMALAIARNRTNDFLRPKGQKKA